jgi:hypothetical protein
MIDDLVMGHMAQTGFRAIGEEAPFLVLIEDFEGVMALVKHG